MTRCSDITERPGRSSGSPGIDVAVPTAAEAWLALTDRQKMEAERWAEVIAPLRAEPGNALYRPGLTVLELAAERHLSPQTVYKRLRWWREGRMDRHGRLIPPGCKATQAYLQKGPARGKPRDPGHAGDVQTIRDLALLYASRTGKTKRLVGLVHQDLLYREKVEGRKTPSRYIINRVISAMPASVLVAAAEGEQGVLKRVAPQLVTLLPEAPNLTWLFDQWIAHTYARMPDGSMGRPIHIHVIDAHAGGPVVGLAIGPSLNADLVARALVDAIGEKRDADPTLKGRPLSLRCDIGKENMAHQVLDGAAALGITVHPTTPRLPQAKGLVEVLHKILDEKFSRRLPHYAPSDIKTKPPRGEDALTFEEYAARARQFLFWTYNAMPYTGRARQGSLSRLELRKLVPFMVVMPSEAELKFAFMPKREATVGRQGVRVIGLLYIHPALYDLIGQRVTVALDTSDESRVFILQEGRLICTATNAQAAAAALTEEGRREFLSARRQRAKAAKIHSDERIQAAKSLPDWLQLASEKKAAEVGKGARGPKVIHQLTRGAIKVLTRPGSDGPPVRRWPGLKRYSHEG